MWSMNFRARSVVGRCVILLLLVAVARMGWSGDETDKKGIVTYVEGMAKKQKLEEADWRSVIKDTPVISGERIRTFSESRAELEIARLDRIRMAPRTTIDILKLYQESVEQVRESNIVLQSGDLWAQVGKKSEKMSFSITTPVAAAAITGTVLRMSVNADSSAELKVYSGEVVLSKAVQAAAASGVGRLEPQQIPGPTEVSGPHEVSLEQWSLIVKSMQRVRVNGKGQVIQNGSFSGSDPDEQSAWVKWNQERDKGIR
jgi:hypothetical protein